MSKPALKFYVSSASGRTLFLPDVATRHITDPELERMLIHSTGQCEECNAEAAKVREATQHHQPGYVPFPLPLDVPRYTINLQNP